MTAELATKLGWAFLGITSGAWLASINVRAVSGHKVRWPIEVAVFVVCALAFWRVT